MAIANDPDINEPYSDGWWLSRLYEQLRVQQKRCKALRARYEGDAPMPFVSDIQKDAVKWFVAKSRTNYERIMVDAVLSRLRIRGIQTPAGEGDHGDAQGFTTWKKARGKQFTLDVHEMALTMSLSFLIVGKNDSGALLVTAEDPRLVTAICDPTDPYRALAALKLFYDDVQQADVAYLYLPGRVRVATKPRKRAPGSADIRFNPRAFDWDDEIVGDAAELVAEGPGGTAIPWLQKANDLPAAVPVIPFFNGKDADSAVAHFEPFLAQIDRLNQQMLQRMTIATIQAFRQRAFKGLPRTDPETGEEIDYNNIFTADPGAVWNLPETADVWESGQVDITPLVNSYRDDVKDLYAVSSTPGYLASPDAANSSAEAASLQREMTTFAVEKLHDRFELSHELACELMFRTLADPERSQPGSVNVIWAPAERLSVSERANAIVQTKGVIPRYKQLTDIWGFDPEEADQAMSELQDDMVLDQQYAAGLTALAGGGA